ncbi:branched-chain amino acid ABC transporter permease [Maritalea porphyrae]|jgi:branched-chain amino acid transport system permease protein|uniref:branched-chain amino acid ABC transporter permease n=1 Tax=Maritalea porphyrae TaxID=880732 RepID=UPI0022B05EB1|nr:branched-chain amino acid ABC transporter permease [Maritalea porphyrae]MCZ4271248.1 branched-chain amino acid ABC transporter permease [Maritalea porphyrae]
MEQLIQFAISVLSLGGTYALLALGLATVFGLLGFLNFAHGDLMTVCGYGLFFMLAAGVPFPVAVLFAVALAGLAAVAMERIAFRPLRGRSPMSLLITSFAISLALHVSFQIFISPKSKPIPIPSYFSGYMTFGDVFISKAQVMSIIISFATLFGLNAFITKTRIGIALRAAASDFTVARSMGINANKMIMLAFGLSGVLAGVAAVMWIAQRGAVFPAMGLTPMVKALIAVIIGGLSNPKGALYGGFLLGLLEASFLYILPDQYVIYRDAAVLLTLIAFLMMRPNGIIATNAEPMR